MSPAPLPPRRALSDAAAGYVAGIAQLPLLVYTLPHPPAIVQALAVAASLSGWYVLVTYLAGWWRLLRIGSAVWAWACGAAGLVLPFGLSVPLAERLFADPRVVFQFTSVGAVLGMGVAVFAGCVAGVVAGLHLGRIACDQDRGRRRRLCARCGYDLRATADPDGLLLPRCPECGLWRRPRSAEPAEVNRVAGPTSGNGPPCD